MNRKLDSHNGYLSKLSIKQDELDLIPCSLDNLSYKSYMLRLHIKKEKQKLLQNK